MTDPQFKPFYFGALMGVNIDGLVKIHFDPRADGVIVPKHLRDQPTCCLDLGFQLRIPMLNFYVDEERLAVTLSFGGHPAHCTIPWKSVYLMIGTERGNLGYVWASDAPPDLPEAVRGTPLAAQGAVVRQAKRHGRGKLRLVQ